MENQSSQNLLDLVPVHNIPWQVNAETNLIEILKPKFENILLKKYLLPRLKSPNFKVNLDEYGTNVWHLIDGNRTVIQISDRLRELFGEQVEPVYERVGQFMISLKKSKFITYK